MSAGWWGGRKEGEMGKEWTSQKDGTKPKLKAFSYFSFFSQLSSPSSQACLYREHELMTCHTLIGSTISIITPAMPKPCPLFGCDSLISGSSRIVSGHDDIQSMQLCQQCLQLGIFKSHNVTVELTVYFVRDTARANCFCSHHFGCLHNIVFIVSQLQ